MQTNRVILLAVMICLVSAITVFLLNGCKVDPYARVYCFLKSDYQLE